MRRVLRAGTKGQDWDEFGERVEGHPEPEHLRSTPQARAQFGELEVRQREGPQPAVVQGRTVLAGACQPGAAWALAGPKHPHRRSDREPFGERTQDFGDARGWRLEAIERGVATGGEGCRTGLTPEHLNAFVLAVRAIAD